MYTGVYYDYLSKKAHIRDDELGWYSFEYRPTYYKLDPDGEFETLDGKRANATKKYDKEDPNLYEKDVDKNTSILLDVYLESDDVPKHHNKIFLDIETQMGGAINLEYCQSAPKKITSIAIYDENGKEYYVYILDEKSQLESSSNKDVRVIPCINEYSLLNSFLDKWQEIDPTIVVHWNGDNFDIPYLYNRMKKILGKEKADSLSPLGIIKFDDFDENMPYKIAGVESLDYLRLYKKFIPKKQPSYSLDAISTKELKKGKIKYSGSLDQLFKTDIALFIEYNVNDVRLIVELDEKKKFLDLAIMVCHMGHVPYHYVYQSSRVIDGAIMTYLKRRNIVSPNKPTTINPELKKKLSEDSEDDEKFAGAYVKEPIPGKYSWNGDEDLESLYPSLGILLNCGLETLLFKVVTDDPFDDSWNMVDMKEKNPDLEIQLESPEGDIRYTTVRKLIKIIDKNDIIISPNGVAFDSKKKSVIVEIMDDWFKKRKEFKELMKKYGKEGDMVKYSFYDLYQQVMKVFLNSIYGCLGLASFRYTDGKDYIASAITSGGRMTIMRTADYANEVINADCGSEGDHAIMSDTDSLFLSATPILEKNNLKNKPDQEIIDFLRKYYNDLSANINNWYKSFCKERFNSNNNRLKIKSELISKSLYVSAKKQYAQYIVDKEGVPVQDFDFKGLDIIKASFPKLFREFAQDLLKDILFDKPKSTIDKKILDFREKYKTLPLEEAAKPTGINKYKEYHGGKSKGSIFSRVLPHCPVNTKAAIYYNDLLKFKGLDREHSIIQVGDRMKWVYLKENPYDIDVIGMHELDPPQEIINFMNKYMDREAIFDKNLVKKLAKIYENLGWGSVNYNKNVNKFFKVLS